MKDNELEFLFKHLIDTDTLQEISHIVSIGKQVCMLQAKFETELRKISSSDEEFMDIFEKAINSFQKRLNGLKSEM